MIRSDLVRMYRDIHRWVGIVCGLFLFIAFYAGAIAMFEIPIQRWASPPVAKTDINQDGNIDAADTALLDAGDDFGFNEGIEFL